MKNRRNIVEQKYPPENPNDLWMKDDILYKSTHKGWTPLTTGSGSSTNGVTSTTWLELKDKRDAGKLTPGSLYRITDYQCTTTQENTRSAGHQFDIVLLALSENKLAEEGWAMEHPTDVYDVTFNDGITKKCYIYKIDDTICNIIIIDTMLGYSDIPYGAEGEIQINEDNKTANCIAYTYVDLNEENLPHNYFQNSKLEAWKVWYCLDNDKSRFAWAQEENIYLYDAYEEAEYTRNSSYDEDIYYGWHTDVHGGYTYYTLSDKPKNGDKYYYKQNGTFKELPTLLGVYATVIFNEAGKGVIYRLIDEWNNDVAYDFKNIQFIRKITDGTINPSTGTDTYVYTFSVCNDDTKELSDYSVTCKTFLDDEGGYALCYENKIKKVIDIVGELYILNNVVFHSLNIPNDTTRPMHHNTCVHTLNLTIGYGNQAIESNIFIYAGNRDYDSALGNNIIVQNTHATFENIT